MFKFYFNKRILVGFLLALTILSWLVISSYMNTKQLVKSSYMVTHTMDVLYHSQRVLAITMNIELGQRGYSLTGEEEFLEPYNKARLEIDNHLQSLLELTRDNPKQQQHVKDLEVTIHKVMEFSSNAVGTRKDSFEKAKELNASLVGKQLMDSIRNGVAEIERDENLLLQARNELNQQQIQEFNYTFILLITVTGSILVIIFFAINHTLKARADAEQRLTHAFSEIRDLYDNAPCGYHSLDEQGTFVEINNTLLRWLGYSKEEMLGNMKFTDIIPDQDIPMFQKNFNQFKASGFVYNLEFDLIRKDGTELPVILSSAAIKDKNGNYIKSRSTTFDNTDRKQAEEKVRKLNKELEAFTYSISHDLRAPLRSIDGYSRILKEDYSGKFDAEGNRVIEVIINNARRMGKLIDDLLDFTRLGRKEVTHSRVNMNQLVETIAKELLDKENRKIEIKVSSLKPSYGDVDMMRQVWENLLSNAIKYTGKTSVPVIEVSSFEAGQEVGYMIKDNGVGFDMQYAPKLFGVFQRLHKMQDFSGTGVGLAIVKRIIDRHDGRVWAEGKINEGATFYFTIPNSNGTQ